MSSRLDLIADHIENGKGFADVGTDHAYLPVIMRRRGYNGKIIATDINEGPLKKAKENLKEHELTDKVLLLLCDGLEGCEPSDIDTIVIAGMGGDTIVGILDRAEWCMSPEYKLILQPVTKPEILRYWLVNNGFIITEDDFVSENGTLYQIICAVFDVNDSYSDAELFVGKKEHILASEYSDEVLDTHIKRFRSAIRGLNKAQDGSLKAWRGILEGILSELLEIKGEDREYS